MDSARSVHEAADPRFVAQLFRERAAELGAGLADRLIAADTGIRVRFGPRAHEDWRENFTNRILDLAAALDAGSADLFAAHAAWSAVAFSARGVPLEDLRLSFEVMGRYLPREAASEDAGLVSEYIAKALLAVNGPTPASLPSLDPGTKHGRLAATYLVAVLEGDRARAANVVFDAVADGLSVRDAYLNVLIPAQRELGRLWHLNELSIAEEHFGTATTQSVAARLAALAPRSPANGRTVITACVEGNTHDLGVRILADFFEFAGWRSIVLGASVPAPDLGSAAADFHADVVALSAALPVHLTGVEGAIRAIRSSSSARIIVGGTGFSGCENSWQSLGADGYAAGMEEAVSLAARLVGVP